MDGTHPKKNEAIKRRWSKRDQAPPPVNSGDLVKYLYVELHVQRDNHRAFKAEMVKLVDIMFDYKRWELIFASYPISGDLNRFVHIWKIPDESTVLETMRAGALDQDDDRDEQRAGRAPETLEEEFRECYQSVQSLIVDTRHALVAALPYDPTHVGYQTQTILIDVDGETFVIDHAELREACQDRNIGADLNGISAGRPKIRAGGEKGNRTTVGPRKQEKPACKKHETHDAFAARCRRLEEIQGHLNRGSTVATIGSSGNRELLFNLAGLKSRSVYQSIDTAKLIADRAPKLRRTDAVGAGDARPDPASQVLIATPWGAVYDLGADDLKKVARLLAPHDGESQEDRDRRGRVSKALEPIIRGNTPLAAIPEERDQIIGDGCACYVINLRSFLVAPGVPAAEGVPPADTNSEAAKTS